MISVDFIIPVRNKVKHIEKCFCTLAAQTYSPMNIIFFDQNSTDGTLPLLDRLITEYRGPNNVKIAPCPPHGTVGMFGLAADYNWIMTQTSSDVILTGSADDFCEPERAERTVEIFERYDPSWVSVRQSIIDPDGTWVGDTHFPNKASRFVTMEEGIRWQIGSSGTQAWARDLWDKYMPLRGMEQVDVVLPIMAFFERGMYFLNESMHTYVNHADEGNTGGGGQILGAKDDVSKAQAIETNNFNLVYQWMSVLERIKELGMWDKIKDEDRTAMFEMISTMTTCWVQARYHLTEQRIRPKGMWGHTIE